MAAAGLRPYRLPAAEAILALDRGSLATVRAAKAAPGIGERLERMKHITGTALAVACIGAIGAALLAGKDDIRKFHRMRSM
jgi:hypothetical protein